MKNIAQGLAEVRESIRRAEQEFGRPEGSVALLAVSKTRPPGDIRAAASLGQRDFGENYVQEALRKIRALADPALHWHFIGAVQSNKARDIAGSFQWVHTLDRLKIARRLNDARPESLPPLDVCIQINVSGEGTKSGIPPQQLPEFARAVAELPRLRLRGLMALPAPAQDFEAQRPPFQEMRRLLVKLNGEGFSLDTLSMGTTQDLRAAVAEGATMVRIGTGIFGARRGKERDLLHSPGVA